MNTVRDCKTEESKKVVEFKHISFEYTEDQLVLDDVSFSINEGEYICIIGHNGSGKSTISKVLTGLLQPKAGEIYLFGEAIKRLNIKHLRDNVGIVFQNPDNQFIGLTAEDDIAFGLENRKVAPEDMWDIIQKAAKIVDVQDLLEYGPQRLSGGQKQRVAIASVLAINPKIIIFDESTSMLDPKAKQELKELMVNLKTMYKKTIISITHDMEEVINADRTIVMEKGKIVKIGTPFEVFQDVEQLKKWKLSIPFTMQLSNLLKKKINLTINANELIEVVLSCQKSK